MSRTRIDPILPSQHRNSFQNPPTTTAELLMTMEKQGLTASAHALGPFAEDL